MTFSERDLKNLTEHMKTMPKDGYIEIYDMRNTHRRILFLNDSKILIVLL
jgi:hypothetical protein